MAFRRIKDTIAAFKPEPKPAFRSHIELLKEKVGTIDPLRETNEIYRELLCDTVYWLDKHEKHLVKKFPYEAFAIQRLIKRIKKELAQKAMTDERLKNLEEYAESDNAAEDKLQIVLAECCREIRRLQEENDQLKKAEGKGWESAIEHHEAEVAKLRKRMRCAIVEQIPTGTKTKSY